MLGVLSELSGDVVVARGRVRRMVRGRSYRQARALAKDLLFSIASVHFGLNITSGQRRSGSPGLVKQAHLAWQWDWQADCRRVDRR